MKSHISTITKISISLSHLLLLSLSIIIPRSIASPNIVKTLPGYPGELPFTLETGYVGVAEEEQVKLFYYFMESERDVESDPLILWLTGGPGCSALSTILFEIGPLTFNLTAGMSDFDTPTLQQNPYSWTKVANIIFLDSPAGTGFSYATKYEDYFSSDTLQSTHILQFLRKWLIDHPKFSESSLYISGDSYSGMIVPIVAQNILQGNGIGVTPKLNLKGYILGNPAATTGGAGGNNVKYKYAQGISLVSDELYKSAVISCNDDFDNVDNAKNTRCLEIMEAMNQDIKSINPGFVIGHKCVNISPKPPLREANPLLLKGEPCWSQNYALAYTWADDEKVREALHVKKGSTGHWVRCNKTLAYTYDVKNSIAYHVNMSRESLQILIYNGDQDMIVPYIGTLKWIKELNVPVTDDWRPWFVDGQVAGYSTEFSVLPYRLVHTTIKGGSHTPADVKPRECLAMIDRWFSLSLL